MAQTWLDIKIVVDEHTILLYSPYHPHLPPKLRGLGRWDATRKVWVFPNTPDALQRIKGALIDVFGWDGVSPEVEVCDVAVVLSGWGSMEFWGLGRCVYRPYRDGRLRVAYWVEVQDEPGGGGSRKHPAIEWAHLIFRCVPLTLVSQLKNSNNSKLTLDVFNVRKVNVVEIARNINSRTFQGGESERLAVMLALTY